MQFLKGLSVVEKNRLTRAIKPVIAARKALLDFGLIEMPKDEGKLKKLFMKRPALWQKKNESNEPADNAKLQEHDEKLRVLREKIDGHVHTRIALSAAFIKAKEAFARAY